MFWMRGEGLWLNFSVSLHSSSCHLWHLSPAYSYCSFLFHCNYSAKSSLICNFIIFHKFNTIYSLCIIELQVSFLSISTFQLLSVHWTVVVLSFLLAILLCEKVLSHSCNCCHQKKESNIEMLSILIFISLSPLLCLPCHIRRLLRAFAKPTRWVLEYTIKNLESFFFFFVHQRQ